MSKILGFSVRWPWQFQFQLVFFVSKPLPCQGYLSTIILRGPWYNNATDVSVLDSFEPSYLRAALALL